MKVLGILISLVILPVTLANCQHESEVHEENQFQHHRLALFTGYGLIPGAINEEGKEQVKIIPVLGLDYEYWFSHKFALGLQTDLELDSYTVEKDHQEYLDREYAFLTALTFLYEPILGWALFAGPGYEFEKNHSFALFRVGTGIVKLFEGGWSTGIIVTYDIKEVNSSPSFGLTLGKRMGSKGQ
jgi:hypothetical protein